MSKSQHSDPRQKEEWRSYLSAAPRKVAIARYHLERLRPLVDPAPEPDVSGLPPIAVQAHFEGVLFSVVAAASQIEEAIKTAGNLARETPRDVVLKSISKPRVKEWYSCPFSADLRAVRNAGFHRSYQKTREEELWFVNEPPVTHNVPPYRGSRELCEYCEAAVEHGEKLLELIPEILRELER